MSSLKATQADGMYVPPDYLTSGAYKKQSVSTFNHKNHKGHNQYLQNSVVRFELPYDGFCLNESCQAHVGKGTRFNAKKAHVDDYFTTKIWEFAMNCRSCTISNFKIRTNPKDRCFDYCSGIKKKVEEFDTVEAGTLGIIDTDDGNGIQKYTKSHDHESKDNDGLSHDVKNISAIDRLACEKIGERKTITERDAMELLLKHNNTTMFDDAMSNSNLRSKYRVVRKAKKRRLGEAQVKGLGMGIELPDSKSEDKTSAKHAFEQSEVTSEKSRKVEKAMFSNLRASSIFGGNTSKRNKCGIHKGLGESTSRNVSKAKVSIVPEKSYREKQKTLVKSDKIVKNGVSTLKGSEDKLCEMNDMCMSQTTSSLSALAYAYGSDSDW
mmetsp:Transcript_12082/g.14979  ORF Transcript_12082/g.14979 Transcript_12082/m.14979 type:complete len:380 (-) Transcript_12082:45-1184(-)